MSSIISKLINLAGNITGVLPVINGGTGVTTSTGTGSVVLSNSPTLVTPALGTPASGVLTNCTGYVSPMIGNVSGSAVASGNVGQTITQTFNATAASVSQGVYQVGSTYSLAAGVWLILGYGIFTNGTVTGNTYVGFDFNTSAATRTQTVYMATGAGTIGVAGNTYPLLINSSGSTNIFAVALYNFILVGSSSVTMYATFVRIA